MEIHIHALKDLGRKNIVSDALPYAVVGGAYDGSFTTANVNNVIVLNYVVPTGKQLKMLFLRVATQNAGGARFGILQTNPTATGQTGTVEAFPVVGSVPSGFRDYPLLEAAGAEVLHGNLRQPVHVLEGSINFYVLQTPTPATLARYIVTWWGIQEDDDQN